ncbi:MAG: hypothetical protein NTY12_05465 [Candidatus Falkowbacteria bacterium]|nr:hypothetical protein [Candidatus Falkowbacteria bacterium]
MKRFIILIISVLILSGCSYKIVKNPTDDRADGVINRGGNIFVKYSSGNEKQVTFTGGDSQPSLSEDKKLIVFVRDIGDKVPSIDFAGGTTNYNQIWLLNLDTLVEKKVFKSSDLKDINLLLNAVGEKFPIDKIANLSNPLISLDNNYIYFMSLAWVTSGAIFSYNLNDNQIKLISDGNSLSLVKDGEFRGDLIISRHKYYEEGGAYDNDYIIDPNTGKELKMLGVSN